MDWLDLLAVQGTPKSLYQHHSSKASILQCSAFFIVQLSHPYMTTGKTIALTRQIFVGKVSLLETLWQGDNLDLPRLVGLLCELHPEESSRSFFWWSSGPDMAPWLDMIFSFLETCKPGFAVQENFTLVSLCVNKISSEQGSLLISCPLDCQDK